MNIGTNGVINTILRWVAGTGDDPAGTGSYSYTQKIQPLYPVY